MRQAVRIFLPIAFAACGGSSPAARDGEPSPHPPTVGINPQPQPAPGKLPGISFDRVTVRTVAAGRVAIVGEPHATDGHGIVAVDLAGRSAPAEATVGDDGAFALEIAGETGDRFLVSAVGGITSACDVVNGTLVPANDCVALASWIDVPTVDIAARTIALDVVNQCDSAVSLAPTFLGAGGGGPASSIASGALARIEGTVAMLPATTFAFVIGDAAGKPRLGAFVPGDH